MVKFSNGHCFDYMVASGALGFAGKGWFWERPLVWLGLIKPRLFTVVTKTLSVDPIPGNLNWLNPFTWVPWSPWSCVRFIKGGAVNKVGLTNPGFHWWCRKIGPKVDHKKLALVASIFGTKPELVFMASCLNKFDLVGIEVNPSCPNTGHGFDAVESIVDSVKAVCEVSKHPVIIKLSVAQDYCEIVRQLEGYAEAVSLNSVPFELAFKASNGQLRESSPLSRLEKRVGGGGGGVSGKPAQKLNWLAVHQLAVHVHAMPVIAPSIMRFDDLAHVRKIGAGAVSFGAIHLRTPWKPTAIVEQDMAFEEESARIGW